MVNDASSCSGANYKLNTINTELPLVSNPSPRCRVVERSSFCLSVYSQFMRKIHLYLCGLLLMMGGLVACNQSPIDPTESEASAFTENIADIRSYALAKGLSVTQTASGLNYVITSPGSTTGRPATLGDELEFSYVQYILQSPTNSTAASGTAVTDRLVDSSYATKSVYYPFFNGSLLSGLQEGLLLMREGQKAVLLIPARLAFGQNGSTNGTIPGNTPVRFDVTLKRSRTEDQQINDYIANQKLTVTETTSSGLRFIKTQSNPTGATPSAGQLIVVNYSGTLFRADKAFDSGSLNLTLNANNTLTISGQQSGVVKGFEEGILKLKVGEKATLIFPSTQGYGTTGAAQNGVYVIPPGSPLRFDVEVVSAR